MLCRERSGETCDAEAGQERPVCGWEANQ
jgi:hypothetical protein